jgi:hypothetical protein
MMTINPAELTSGMPLMNTPTVKQERMALRRDIGNRRPSSPEQKVVGPAYLFPYACFSCRKSFKRKFEDGLPNKTCPNCGGVAIGLSRNFKAPASSDSGQWKKVEFLVEHGFRFYHQYNVDGHLVPYPATLAEAKDFVALYPRTTKASADSRHHTDT